jgi:hypothetical protein
MPQARLEGQRPREQRWLCVRFGEQTSAHRALGYASQPSCKGVVITVGIDVAAQPERTAACWIRWDNNVGTVEQVEQPLADDRLRSILVEDPVDKVGIDVPLGWPAAFVSAIGAHNAGKLWPAGTSAP